MEPLNRTNFYITRSIAFFVIAVGLLVLWGWQINSVFLKQIMPGLVSMNPVTAVCFIFCGCSFLLLQQAAYPYQRILANSLLAVIILLATLRLLGYFGIINIHIEYWLFTEKVKTTLYQSKPGTIVPHASISFLLTCGSLFFMGRNKSNSSQWFALPVAVIGLLSVLGYLYHLSFSFRSTSFVPMSIHTGVCFLLFSNALLFAKSRDGFVAEITSLHAGGKAARMILPWSLIITTVLGYVVLNGVLKEKFSIAVWVSFLITAAIFLFGIMVWITAYSINKFEAKRLLEKQIADEKLKQMAEQQYRQSQERYYTLMNSVDGIVWEADAQTFEFSFVSKQAERLLGYPVERWINEPSFWSDHIHEEDRSGAVSYCAKSTEEGKSHQFEYRMMAADGRILWLRDIVAVIMEDGKPVRLSGIMVDITEQRLLEKHLQEKELSQQKLITEITILAQEKERNELGLELHDNINQLLSVVKLYLGVAKTEKTFNEEIIERSYLHLEEAMQDIRKLSHTLVAPSLGHDGLKEALEDLAESVQEPNKLMVKLSIDEDYNALQVDKNKELMIYRIVQEQLSNIIKYAKASEVNIHLKQQGENLVLYIRDNGVGFDVEQQGSGIGLKNINSRVNFYSGKMHLFSAPGQGCSLEVSIPN